MTSRFLPFAFVELVSPYNKKNITRWLEDMNFMFEWQEQYLTIISSIYFISLYQRDPLLRSALTGHQEQPVGDLSIEVVMAMFGQVVVKMFRHLTSHLSAELLDLFSVSSHIK